jgi:hypothetical protein
MKLSRFRRTTTRTRSARRLESSLIFRPANQSQSHFSFAFFGFRFCLVNWELHVNRVRVSESCPSARSTSFRARLAHFTTLQSANDFAQGQVEPPPGGLEFDGPSCATLANRQGMELTGGPIDINHQ